MRFAIPRMLVLPLVALVLAACSPSTTTSSHTSSVPERTQSGVVKAIEFDDAKAVCRFQIAEKGSDLLQWTGYHKRTVCRAGSPKEYVLTSQGSTPSLNVRYLVTITVTNPPSAANGCKVTYLPDGVGWEETFIKEDVSGTERCVSIKAGDPGNPVELWAPRPPGN